MADAQAQADLIGTLRALLQSYGLESLTDWMIASVKADKDNATIITELRQTDQYKARFPAMAELQRKAIAGTGIAIDEGTYLALERGYRQVFANSGLPASMFDTPDDFARLIQADVSVDEAQARVAAAKQAVENTDPNTRYELARMYGVTTGDLMAYALDPERKVDYLQKVATSAILSGYSKSAGLAEMSREQWEGYAQDLINQQIGDEELRGIIASATQLSNVQGRLASIEGSEFDTEDALDVTVRKDANKALQSQKRVEREVARWSGSSGLSSSSLQGKTI